MDHGVGRLIEIFRVANDDVIGKVARKVFNLKWKEGLSARNQAHKILDELALTNKIIKGKGFYAVNEYRGEFKEHDKLVTNSMAELILLKLPITVYREVSAPIGIRSDIITLIKKDGEALCAVIEVANNETPEYLNQKVVAWKNWKEANIHLSNLFGINIPCFSIVTHGINHPDTMSFESFIEEVQK